MLIARQGFPYTIWQDFEAKSEANGVVSAITWFPDMLIGAI
jgi:hypothetical protein